MDRTSDTRAAVVYLAAGLVLFVVGTVLTNSGVDPDLNDYRVALGLDPQGTPGWRLAVGGFAQFVGQVTMAVGLLVSASKYFRA